MPESSQKLAALQKFWNTYRETYTRRGLDVEKLLAGWAEQKRQSLEETGAKDSFDKLCELFGCAPLPLAITLAIIQPLRSIGNKWPKISGSTTREREKKIRALEKAASVLEDLLDSAADDLISDFGESMSAEDVNAWRHDVISPSQNAVETVASHYWSHPAVTIEKLRAYASILKHTSDPPELLARYLVTAYVYRTTGDFHDEEVSGLIDAARDDIEVSSQIGDDANRPYEATAHKSWRNRNYKRLDKSLGFVADILTDFGKVLAK